MGVQANVRVTLPISRPVARKARGLRAVRRRRTGSFRWSKLWPKARVRRRIARALGRAPRYLQLIVGAAAIVVLWLALNWTYQVIRKPSELFFPVSGTLNKTPAETWQQYAPIFREHATRTMTPELLAALAQVEGSGNPIVRTYWRWSLTPNPFEVFRPASSAVGMYQITDGTFAEARRYCIHDHVVVEDGPWSAWRSCWFNSLYTRVVPSHAVELTSAYLDRGVTRTLQQNGISGASPAQKQNLVAVMHLCGAGAGATYARRGFRLTAGQRCGDHATAQYIARVNTMKRLFTRLASGS